MQDSEQIHVLVVDDSATIRNVIAKHLGDSFCISHAENGEIAWGKIQQDNSIQLVFADLHMPVMNGMVLLKQIRESGNNHIAELPVIMITGHEDSDAAKLASYNMGATDFISKPFSATDIISRTSSYSKLNNKIASLEQNVTRDSLTDLFNQRGIEELGDKAVAGAHRHQFELSVLTMQIADLETLQSSYGNTVCSQIISTVANNLKDSLRKEEAMAHLGSGKFLLLLPMTKAFRAHIVGIRFQKAISNLAFKTESATIRIKLAAGLNSTEGYNENVTFKDLNKQADLALQESLQRRACQIVRHDETLSKEEADKPASVKSEKSSLGNDLAANIEKLDSALFSRYMLAIVNREYEKVPLQHLKNMIDPLDDFLTYARSQLHNSGNKNIKKY